MKLLIGMFGNSLWMSIIIALGLTWAHYHLILASSKFRLILLHFESSQSPRMLRNEPSITELIQQLSSSHWSSKTLKLDDNVMCLEYSYSYGVGSYSKASLWPTVAMLQLDEQWDTSMYHYKIHTLYLHLFQLTETLYLTSYWMSSGPKVVTIQWTLTNLNSFETRAHSVKVSDW